MSSVVVSITLHGLIALVPVNVTSDGVTLSPSASAAHMAALLVDAHDPPAMLAGTDDGPADSRALSCVTRHDALLQFTIPDSSVPDCSDKLGCKALPAENSKPRVCSCVPAGKRIWLTPDYSPAPHAFLKRPSSPMPLEHGTPDFSYFPNISRLGYALDRNTLSGAPSALLARMVFPFDGLTTCDLAVRRGEDQEDNVHSFGFRNHNGAPSAQQPRQAVAQRLIASSTYQIGDAPLLLNMGDLADGGHAVSILLAEAGNVGIKTVDIKLLNDRPTPLDFDDPCNDGVGRDFALFYRLAAPAPANWITVPLPHLVLSLPKLAADVENHACSMAPDKGMVSRPICAMGTFIE